MSCRHSMEFEMVCVPGLEAKENRSIDMGLTETKSYCHFASVFYLRPCRIRRASDANTSYHSLLLSSSTSITTLPQVPLDPNATSASFTLSSPTNFSSLYTVPLNLPSFIIFNSAHQTSACISG